MCFGWSRWDLSCNVMQVGLFCECLFCEWGTASGGSFCWRSLFFFFFFWSCHLVWVAMWLHELFLFQQASKEKRGKNNSVLVDCYKVCTHQQSCVYLLHHWIDIKFNYCLERLYCSPCHIMIQFGSPSMHPLMA